MRTFLLAFFSLLAFNSFGQTLTCEGLKNLIGERVSDFEEVFQITSTKKADNFGDFTVYYQGVAVDDYTLDIVLETEGKNIRKITVTNFEERTTFFKNVGLDLQKSTPEKKNYKNLYVSLTRNKTGKKTYFESINDLIEVLRKQTTDLTENHGLLESHPLNTTLTIDSEKSVLTINENK